MSAFASLPSGLGFWRPATLLATWFGVGLLPRAPGTWGSLAALPLAWLLGMAGGSLAVAGGAAVIFLAGWWAAERVVRRGGDGDPSFVVIDEVAGQLVALAVIPLDPVLYAAAFLGFRVFDILKPWPVGWADRALKGGLGIMLDDLFAGLYVAAILFAVTRFVAV